MPKRKAPPGTSGPHRHGKQPRLHSSATTESPAEIDILHTDPSTLSPKIISSQKTIVSQKLHHAYKIVARALKLGRGFERQRLGKKLKAAREAGDEVFVGRVEMEMRVLKEMELEVVARGAVRKGLGKRVKGWVFFPVEELEVGEKNGNRKKEEGEGVKKARNNVVAALCNMKPVREAVKAAVEMVREVAVSKWAPERGEVGGGDEGEGQENGDATAEGEWSEWNGIEDSTNPGTPAPAESEEDRPVKNTKSKPSIKLDISLIDPSRGPDDEWSGGESDGGLVKAEESESAVEEEIESNSVENLSEHEIIEGLGKFIAPGSDGKDDGEGEDNSDPGSNDPDIDDKPRHSKKALITKPKPTPKTSSTRKSKLTPPTPSRTPSPAPASTKKKPLPITKSIFLPSLMGGYISGSESDSDPFHPNKRSTAQRKQRKNRMGQQARRALAEKKYKENARHVKLGLGSGKREDKVDLRRGRRGEGGYGRGEVKVVMDEGRKRVVERKKDTEGPLHPSWEAARKAKELKARAEFQGKKIKFD